MIGFGFLVASLVGECRGMGAPLQRHLSFEANKPRLGVRQALAASP
jgi:hypothetical protein